MIFLEICIIICYMYNFGGLDTNTIMNPLLPQDMHYGRF